MWGTRPFADGVVGKALNVIVQALLAGAVVVFVGSRMHRSHSHVSVKRECWNESGSVEHPCAVNSHIA